MAVWVWSVCICMSCFLFCFLWPLLPSICLPAHGLDPVCFSFKSKMCIANLRDDLSLVGPASYLAPLGPKSIARLSCYAGTAGVEGFWTEVACRMWEMKVPLMCLLVPLCSEGASLPHASEWVHPHCMYVVQSNLESFCAGTCGQVIPFFSVKLQSPALVFSV